MHSLLHRNKKYLKIILIIILIGIVMGVIYFNFLNIDIKTNISNTLAKYNYHYNFILKNLIIMSLLLVLSFLIIGLPLSIFYLFYESFTIGFLINSFYYTFSIKGFIYSILYIIINKLLVYILLIIFIKKIINISRYIIGLILYKKDSNIKDKIIINFKNSLYIIIFVLIINIILYFISPYIFNKLLFLIY